MSDLIKNLGQAEELHTQTREAHQAFIMKNGQLEDLMRETFVKELGYAAEEKEIPLPTLLKKAYMIGYRAAKAEK